jgi:CBS domain-containing protein
MSGSMEAGLKVADVMTREVFSVSPDDRLRRAATIMRETVSAGFRWLTVTVWLG